MKLQQLRYLREVAKRRLNLSEAAEALHTSQPGISKQIRQLEDELGVDILVRNGKRVVDVTEPGRAILGIAERILQDADNLRQVAREFRDQAAGTLTIATEALDQYPKLLALAGYQWRHCVVVPAKHALLKEQRITLEMLAQYPIITYDPAFAGRSHIDDAFRASCLVFLSAPTSFADSIRKPSVASA